MSEYLVVIEGERDTWSAYVPDPPGCVSAGSGREEVEQLIREAIHLHVELMREHGDPVPPPSARAAIVVEVA
ncbi:MAG: type II toxin-antitoxin system HicB family antitoxin [Acidimicrobiales bacterium]